MNKTTKSRLIKEAHASLDKIEAILSRMIAAVQTKKTQPNQKENIYV